MFVCALQRTLLNIVPVSSMRRHTRRLTDISTVGFFGWHCTFGVCFNSNVKCRDETVIRQTAIHSFVKWRQVARKKNTLSRHTDKDGWLTDLDERCVCSSKSSKAKILILCWWCNYILLLFLMPNHKVPTTELVFGKWTANGCGGVVVNDGGKCQSINSFDNFASSTGNK